MRTSDDIRTSLSTSLKHWFARLSQAQEGICKYVHLCSVHHAQMMFRWAHVLIVVASVHQIARDPQRIRSQHFQHEYGGDVA